MQKNKRGCFFFSEHSVDWHIYAWAPSGVGKADTCPPPLGKCQRARFASVNYHVLVRTKRTKISPDRFYGFKIYLNVFALGNLTVLPVLPAAFEPFEGRG